MRRSPRILFLTPSLAGGGAQRVIAHLVHGLSAHEYDLHLALLSSTAVPRTLAQCAVTVHSLNCSRVRTAGPALLRLIRKLRPHVIFSGIAHLNALVLLLRPLLPTGTRIIIRQNGLWTCSSIANSALLTQLTYRHLYPRADRIICQTASMAEELTPRKRCRAVILPNPVDIDEIRNISDAAAWHSAGPHLLAVGRLVHEKGFDLLLRAFSKVIAQFPAAELVILGEGPEADSLRLLSQRLRVSSPVRFAGHIQKPFTWFPSTTLFVSSAREDVLPNALLEAAAFGLPIAATPAHGGIPSLLRNDPGAWLADAISAQSLSRCICNALTSLHPQARCSHPWIETFRLQDVLIQYRSLLDEVLAEQQ